ncbi:hypothetical protein TBLA_0C07110 [Henningerozyma blattae CBS 6284]|uniref:Eukaryotic translation initiation factor 3 subunit C n=1 Tax=Henningerozyma blattae (strain ATCC 34711 / CBS 6284 / DSM 70876 / NBRC 10599 / NRRL Y-10934 / UCD 77-7) TaxID=1071380 RepID=I2H2A0_HENB6|nr:hypothetical protein TBLA_0C07110 [Tetrapisispora blattae CBS 6284]CCH60502.1 hypothetical protein TBLA_0C07110 [Tetrapisispora blattae CBS 6284]
MSRFFASTTYDYESGSSSSEEDLLSSSSEDELLSSSGDESQDLQNDDSDDSFFENDESEEESDFDSDDSDSKPYGPDWFKKPEFRKGGASNKFLKGNRYSDSDDSDDEGAKVVVKSAKEKLLDEMQMVYNKIDAAELTNDWVTILNEFETITKLLIRSQQQNFGIPNIFIKVIAQIEDAVSEVQNNNANNEEASTTSNAMEEIMKNKAVARAFNTMKQRIKKTARENEQLLEDLRKDPESFDKEPTVDLEVSLAPEPATFTLKNAAANLSSMANATSEVNFFSALQIVLDSRGKKNVDQSTMVKTMQELINIAKSPYELIMGYLTLIPVRFDSSATLAYQPVDQWKSSLNDIESLMNILDENINKYQVTELTKKNDSIEIEPTANEKGVKQILGSLFSFVERLDDEFNKSLLNTDPHSSDYLLRLRDEQSVYNLILRVQLYMEAILNEDEQKKVLNRVFIRRLDHIYYKQMNLINIIESTAWENVPSQYTSKYIPYEGTVNDSYIATLIKCLSETVSSQSNELFTKRAILYHIYFIAVNVDFYAAKDMLLNSKVQEYINTSDPSVQILYNRVVVQLGLAAFKLCLIEDCHQVLNELLCSPHLKEILGQQSLHRIVAPTNPNNTSEQREQLCLPYHQHINLDLIDIVFLTSSLLIEIPQMAAFYSGIKVRKLPFSQRSARRLLEHYEKSSFQGPPETLRDYVLHAAKSMQNGDWKQCYEFLKSIQTWNLLHNSEEVLEKLIERIQIESLKTYFLTYRRFYSSFSIVKLSELFSLSEEKIIEVLDDAIKKFGINVSIDETKKLVKVEKGEAISKLEEVALKLRKEYKLGGDRFKLGGGRR